MLPSFVIIGGQKCGTTSLANQVATHPEIGFSEPKEVHFFSWEKHWSRGLRWYESLFEGAEGAKAVGEGSTTYTKYPKVRDVPTRMAQVLPDARLIYLVRHPVDRLISHYMHKWYESLVGDDLEEALEKRPQLIAYGRYYYQIEQFLPFFPPERLLVLIFEEFIADPIATHRRVYEFLGVDPTYVPSDVSAKNVTAAKVRRSAWIRAALKVPFAERVGRRLLPAPLKGRLKQVGTKMHKPEIPPALRERLLETFLPDVQALSDFLGRDLKEIWKLTP